MRLFIAAELPDAMIDALATTQAALRDSVRGRYVPPTNFHVTLAFLGEVAGSLAGGACDALEDACAGAGPIEARLSELGIFGRPSKAVLWQAVRSGGALENMAERVRGELATRGFSFDEKGFCPHVTLMRAADIAGRELPMPCVEGGLIDTVTLFASDLSGNHPVYERVESAVLG